MHARLTKSAFGLLVCVALLGAGCGGGEAPSKPTGQPTTARDATSSPTAEAATGGALEGSWSGTWESTSSPGAGGDLRIEFSQSGEQLTGQVEIDGTPCLTTGTISGNLSGNAIVFGAVQGEQQVAFTGEVSGDAISGTYSAPACDNGTGTWEASRG